MNIRTGYGYDSHRLVEGRPFLLGGVLIPFQKGGMGHSDADVLLHAIADALLGAVALGDIGLHFPDTDPAWKDADSRMLLAHVVKLLREKGWTVGNMDCTVVLEQPKLRPHVEAMRQAIAGILGTPVDAVSVKASTNERMGFTGRGEGVAAHAVVLVHRTGA
ncbi:MAG: 2-C-methyl-D-erythritol 2,4-cyclodiphosphate synthase [Flavobacteriales bacterium]|nr:2-C-methyl-D-erythritol 2,4-cyclodiphosphate synthase [Flavobacteriales bacterium]HRO39542.1 2-C-methyl-D-erythritol 2,4-cyclodiphosphate synthase [Flavobacteriales bacterium]HRP81781.1 2-C-methyl-D-erythritol 2,4-cyclodiphosphate synthase [Flavobacteriales bacterium]